jgi:putative ABC transport system permease protein
VLFLAAIRLALQQITVQKLKSFFTVLGVTIGVMFLIAVVSIVSGMGHYMEDQLVGKIIAINSFDVLRRPNLNIGDVSQAERRSWQLRRPLYDYDVDPIVSALIPGTLYSVYSGNQVTVESRYARPRQVSVSGVTEDYFTIKKMGVTSGRLISPPEYSLGATVVVIGPDVKDHFFPNLDAVGRELRVDGVPYTVVGVAESQGSAFGFSFDKFLIAPGRAPLRHLLNPHGVIDGISIQSPTRDEMTENMERVRQVLRARHRLRPWQPDDFSLETSESALAFWDKIKQYLELAGIALPAIGLVVGAIVIMNIMLVAVAERTHEIGIRKSLGARRRDILNQFLIESTTLATFGAAIGVGMGIGLAKVIAAVSPLPASVEPWSIVLGVAVGAGVGIIAGVYPASRAALLDPIAALRHET